MSRFEDCLAQNGLGEMIEAQYGRWGHFSAEAADAIIQVVRLEVREPGPAALINLMAQLAYTWMNESVFRFYPEPNMNGQPENTEKWDIGPGQLNVHWTRRAAVIKEFDLLPERQVFGTFAAKFDGDPIANLRQVCRVLQAIRAGRDKGDISQSLLETQVTHYTGPNARPARRENWRKYGGLLREFFICYELDTKGET